ncbi:phage major capsid protein [Mesorhizobium huakuii]|uniref:Phage major capsid protein n=1 Tax=Mesorhizobium huakuii TaxID=28104 RepID=A0A7G6SZB8_9HYPH|nr:phage major capsid protein [Mesorhizobium huakuii]QND59850.1 phage major capsid protein [Mesorhizobium huakuii]
MWEDSAADLGAFFVEELSACSADLEDDAGFNGDGTSTYAGISGICPKFVAGLGGASQLAGAVVATSAHDTFEEIDATDIAALMAALPERYWTSAKFYVSGYGAAKCFARIGATVGGWIMTANGLRPMLSFMGFPIVLSPKLPGSGDLSNRVMIVFGDMRAAVSFGSRKGVSVAVSQNRYFDLDQIGVRGIERYDINCHGVGDATTAGPLVALIGN